MRALAIIVMFLALSQGALASPSEPAGVYIADEASGEVDANVISTATGVRADTTVCSPWVHHNVFTRISGINMTVAVAINCQQGSANISSNRFEQVPRGVNIASGHASAPGVVVQENFFDGPTLFGIRVGGGYATVRGNTFVGAGQANTLGIVIEGNDARGEIDSNLFASTWTGKAAIRIESSAHPAQRVGPGNDFFALTSSVTALSVESTEVAITVNALGNQWRTPAASRCTAEVQAEGGSTVQMEDVTCSN